MQQLEVTSKAFKEGQPIPQKYTSDGADINPPLTIAQVPDGAKSLALIVDDPDAPAGTWTHWVVWNIEASDSVHIEEDSVPGVQGENDFKKKSYGGPSPPSGTHRYFFKAYALDDALDIEEGTTRRFFENAMKGHVLAQGKLMGRYKKR